jgi:hypothetical protein
MNEHGEGIQADKPIPPWEQPGCFRRDCEPHRGNLLWWLAAAGLTLGGLALFPWCWPPGLIGIPFNLCIRYLAKTDLAKMQAGLMDPYGEGITASAKKISFDGLVCSVVGMVLWGGLYLLLFFRIMV